MDKKFIDIDDKKQFVELFTQSLKNRFEFLEVKKREWIELDSERKKKAFIVKLIQLEPSHLAEDWILDQVIKWLKDWQNNIDYIKAAFIAKGCREELTEQQRDNLARTSFLSHKISKEAKTAGSRAKAIRKIILESDDDDLPEQPEQALGQKLKRYRKVLNSRVLPFPYYGHDFIEVDRGNENHRIEFHIFNKPGIVNDHALFGNTTFSYSIKPTK
ncbi:MAG: hypothetical protein R6W88_08890 [Desulfobacterales bacterium]